MSPRPRPSARPSRWRWTVAPDPKISRRRADGTTGSARAVALVWDEGTDVGRSSPRRWPTPPILQVADGIEHGHSGGRIRPAWEPHDHPNGGCRPHCLTAGALPRRHAAPRNLADAQSCRRPDDGGDQGRRQPLQAPMMVPLATGFRSWRSRVSRLPCPPSSRQAGNEEGRHDRNVPGSTKLCPASLGKARREAPRACRRHPHRRPRWEMR
jgi:hypothetical protein